MNNYNQLEQTVRQKAYLHDYTFNWQLAHPKYWGIWLLMGVLWILAKFPLSWLNNIGRLLGRLLYKIGGRRLNIARKNLELCFPSLTQQQRESLLKCHLEAVGFALIEPGLAWWSSEEKIKHLCTVEGAEDIKQLLDQGQGVLLCGLHMTSVEMVARALGLQVPYNLLYRVHDNPVYEYVSGKCRQKYQARFIPRKQVKDLLYFLQKGELGVILPDNDMGLKRSIFVPFFGVPAATITSPTDFAKQTGAKVAMIFYSRDQQGRYHIKCSSPLNSFPSEDAVADMARINSLIEGYIKQHPEQYLWLHRRFKNRPAGEAKIY
ncbi:LpxL/LpxP family Kdo(2)-lipid IV(A) lauroyl/palmitoleoyl acyltransferase [Endozoicomonas sp. SM1973]|uniref:Lipid A biosynthesis acyltransferase n=1 Tax=Spartinivicinus marinus TaxID=2994442 RepID=A0A853I9L0_9GAMM|nr:LpxL/LpxP family Kdo(2)-lipid IV(A) lauroyl/palmitoleoyl acyltransferase [Spartinivicinus marinus]MCX4028087.1 LpxL/LpxP family Kdo(2)-lipid IV(A) lauroyl/palmitoleoyl acyltransferase [Spartinivicinus marinus]NYZ66237.1 LpxL/LpxP family Kdo(2)-lipid IV(A) lauroyl/palmitoleoyl acyltransferase [Spartinivicinus marinus]